MVGPGFTIEKMVTGLSLPVDQPQNGTGIEGKTLEQLFSDFHYANSGGGDAVQAHLGAETIINIQNGIFILEISKG